MTMIFDDGIISSNIETFSLLTCAVICVKLIDEIFVLIVLLPLAVLSIQQISSICFIDNEAPV